MGFITKKLILKPSTRISSIKCLKIIKRELCRIWWLPAAIKIRIWWWVETKSKQIQIQIELLGLLILANYLPVLPTPLTTKTETWAQTTSRTTPSVNFARAKTEELNLTEADPWNKIQDKRWWTIKQLLITWMVNLQTNKTKVAGRTYPFQTKVTKTLVVLLQDQYPVPGAKTSIISSTSFPRWLDLSPSTPWSMRQLVRQI